jgi:hypothetical protein
VAEKVEILVHGVGGALVPLGFIDLLLGGRSWMNSPKRPSRKLQPRWM